MTVHMVPKFTENTCRLGRHPDKQDSCPQQKNWGWAKNIATKRLKPTSDIILIEDYQVCSWDFCGNITKLNSIVSNVMDHQMRFITLYSTILHIASEDCSITEVMTLDTSSLWVGEDGRL